MHNMEINIFLCQHCYFNNINNNYTSTPGHQNWTLVCMRDPCYENTGRNVSIAPTLTTFSLYLSW